MLANNYIKNLRSYPVISHKAWELPNSQEVLKLDWNEATVPPSPKVREQIEVFLSNGQLNWYPDINNEKLIKAIAEYSQVEPKNLQYFASSDALHEYIIGTFIKPRDSVTIISPTYDNFRASAESRGALVNYYKLREPFDFCQTNFSKHLEQFNPRIVYLCNPNNPTGTIYEISVIEKLVNFFPKILFIIDEAYYEFTNRSARNIAVKHHNVIVSRTFSKAFALAGFRIGYAISSVENIQYLNKIRNPKNITTLSQIAAMAALNDLSYTKTYVEEVLQTKQWLCNKLEKMKDSYFDIFKGGGNFILFKMSPKIKNRIILYLQNKNIFVRDYSHVEGMDGYIRLTIGTKEQMNRFVEEFLRFDHDK